MLPIASYQTLEALKRLSENPDWPVLKAWLSEGREEARDRLERAADDDYRTVQGHAQVFSEIVKAVDEAREAIARKQQRGNR